MVSGPDPVDCVVRAVKDALSPFAKGFEVQWASTVQECKKGDTFEGFGVVKGRKVCGNGGVGAVVTGDRRNCSGEGDMGDFVAGERRKGPIRSLIGALLPNGSRRASSLRKVGSVEDNDGVSACSNCLQFSAAWSLLVNGFVQAFPSPLKSVKKCFRSQCRENDAVEVKLCAVPVLSGSCVSESRKLASGDGEMWSLELVLCLALESLVQNLNVLDLARDGGLKSSDNLSDCVVSETEKFSQWKIENFGQWKIVSNLIKGKDADFNKLSNCVTSEPEKVGHCKKVARNSTKFDKLTNCVASSPEKVDHWRVVKNLISGNRVTFDSFIWNMKFARVGGVPTGLVGATAPENDEDEEGASSGNRLETEIGPSQNITSGLLNMSLSNVERLKSTISTVSLSDLIESIPQLGRPSAEHPDKKKLFSVQDFFRYAEAEGRRFFDELDRDGDGQVSLEDLEVAMRKRKLPRRYAKDFLRRTRSNMFAKSIGWKQFLSLMEQKEPTILRAYTTLCLSKSGTIQNSQILTSLRSAGLPASEDNAAAMMRYLNADKDASISYSHFRNFMLLLPSERLEEDPRSIWFEAATVVAVPPPVEISTGNVLKSALAGGLASALSTSMLHPIDTMKTRLQASSLSLPELVSTLPQIGIQGLYRGSIPAILGQFSSHGVRTGIFEATKLVLVNVAPTLPEIQVQSVASFCSTILGTAVRIPCEVLKQRLQAGIFDNVGEAIVGTFQHDGLKGFFRGTGATLCREVPFYVAGMCLYAEAKKAAQTLLSRELEPWETIAVGALSGGLAAVVTTPFDVMKTRTMTAPQGLPVSMQMIAFSILQKEGPIGFFKGAVPRFFWIAPLGAMNFAGYELAKKAMVKDEQIAT